VASFNDRLQTHYEGKIVRKDLLHKIKKGTNVPTFVLEYLLAKYCASTDQLEIDAGLKAVLETLQENYVRPDEANAAQSRVARDGKHRFIDKVHVLYTEKEKRHWAALENFNSRRVAIGERHFKDHDRLLEGGLWAEVVVAHNDVDGDTDYAFYIDELRPIQLARFDFQKYIEGRKAFTRDEWLDLILRSIGLEPKKMDLRTRMHCILRLCPLVEKNYNFIELGPRGTGKSYFFSEFSPYSTLISGGQATKAVMFYNNNRHRVGLVGYWDVVAFDEVGKIHIRDQDAIQIMKDYMANGRFSRGAEVIADASLAFVGNIDQSIQQLVSSTEHDLFQPLPPEFDLAIMDRFAAFLPGWEMPKNSSDYLTSDYGLITDYMAEAFHYLFKHQNRYQDVDQYIKLGKAVEGRDEKGIKKTLCAFLKILHPDGMPSALELDEYVSYAVEMRRRVKEQMNKRKPDDEFANIGLSFFNAQGEEVVVTCPESVVYTQVTTPVSPKLDSVIPAEQLLSPAPESSTSTEEHYTIRYSETGYDFERIFGPYAVGAREVIIEDPYVRIRHQVQNLLRFCEFLLKQGTIRNIKLITGFDTELQKQEVQVFFNEIGQSLLEHDVQFSVVFKTNIHDREIRFDNGWIVKIGRGLDFYQKPESWFEIGASDLALRPCLETKVDVYRG